MTHSDDYGRQIAALRERIAALNAASLRISASLDLDTVLAEVIQSARGLTGARFGVIATVDKAGAPRDVAFSGFTPEQERELAAWPDSGRLFAQLREQAGPLRLADLSDYVRSLGWEPAPAFQSPFLAVPMLHRGAEVGRLFLAAKADGEQFSDDDEEVLKLVASQAADAIANARTHRTEQRARADLEALVETSPVGVVVVDLRAGRVLLANREMRRIVGRLVPAGPAREQVLEAIRFRLGDGQDAPFRECPLVGRLRAGETVRAEEAVLSVPDGPSVRTLVNATPVRAAGDEVRSAAVTFQDLAPLEEIERMRSEFLSLVSHELRAPLSAITGSTLTLLEEVEDLDRAEMHEFHRIIEEQARHMRGLINDLLDSGRIDSGTLSVAPQALELAELVERARDTFQGAGGRHGVVVDLPVDLPTVMADRRRIVQVLNNLLANAARHSPESSSIRVAAAREDAHVAVAVSDEGRGVAPELLPRLFSKHAGGGQGPAAGYGLGLAICKGLVEAHGGRIRAESAGVGRGTTVTFTLPVAREPGAEVGSDPPPAAGEQGEPSRILVVDDDPRMLRFARDTLAASGYAPLVTGEPRELAHIVRTEKPRLVLLDLMLPGGDGIALMENVPELTDLPVIFISGYGRDETVARALEAGAADYIVKPFSPTELVARVRAALRRYEEPEPFVLGELAIDYERRRVRLGGSALELTATEYELLRLLSLNAGRVVTYGTLQRRVWPRHEDRNPSRVRLFVKNLRRKLGDDAADPAYILTERGVGYRMPAPGGL